MLRDAAAIGYDELAARAHYPSDILKEAENGPYLPTLPILAAYVRACEGDVVEWEERWRRVANEAAGDPGLPVRSAGASPAAVAGARAGVSVVPPDAYDPERIKAALRGGGSQRSDQPTAARDTDPGGTDWSFADVGSTGWDAMDAPAAGWTATGPGWDTATDQASANGNREALVDGSFGAIEGQFAGSWSQDSELLADQQVSGSGWPGLPETELEPWSAGAEAAPPESADGELAWPDPAQGADEFELAQPNPAGDELAGAEPAAWNGAGQVASAGAQAAVPEQKERAADRLYPLRLLLIIVIAALVGSGLVLLFK